MSYPDQKKEIIKFFDNYVFEYLIPDLEKLNAITPDTEGRGGCTIPQAITVFSAVDLFGYFTDPNPSATGIAKMKLKTFLGNSVFFPELDGLRDLEAFLNSLRDDVRSIMTHRFFLTSYHIAKLTENSLFVDQATKRVFNVSYFTGLVIRAIRKLHDKIQTDAFILPGDSTKEDTMQRLFERLNSLKAFKSDELTSALAETFISSTSTSQTTNPLG